MQFMSFVILILIQTTLSLDIHENWTHKRWFSQRVANESGREVITWRWRWSTEKIRLQQSRPCFDVMRRFWIVHVVESRDDVGWHKNDGIGQIACNRAYYESWVEICRERVMNKSWTCRGQNWSWSTGCDFLSWMSRKLVGNPVDHPHNFNGLP
jgi:hypothetical protein